MKFIVKIIRHHDPLKICNYEVFVGGTLITMTTTQRGARRVADRYIKSRLQEIVAEYTVEA